MLFPIILPVILGAMGVYLLLPRVRPYPIFWGTGLSAMALLLAGFTLIRSGMALPENLLFYCFSAIAIVAGVLLITQRNPVHAALSFALVVLSTCGLFLLQAAPFLMAATTIVYAGAIVVTFLFVIMLAQQTGWSDADWRSREPFIATLAGFVLVGALLYLLQKTYETPVLDKLLERAEAASQSDSPSHELGNDEEFLAALQAELEKIRGGQDREALLKEVTIVRGSWKEWKDTRNFQEMRATLHRIAENGSKLRDQIGTMSPQDTTREHMSGYSVIPNDGVIPENVAPLGRTLFTDYLLPVELGGTLLLVATIGAIAISGRRTTPPHANSLRRSGEGSPELEGKP
jgi:NADH:ubiquinone oxidoreductase subunit 6 (subunit J)